MCVYGYRITVCDKARPKKAVLTKEIYSEYYFEPMPQTLTCTLDGLTAGRDYTVQVIPLGVWKQTGSAFTAAFQTEG